MNKKRLIRGFLIAPMVGLFYVVVLLFCSSLFKGLLNGFNTKPTLSVFILTVVIIGIPLFLAMALIIMLPVIIFLVKRELVSIYSFVFSGSIVGMIFGILVILVDKGFGFYDKVLISITLIIPAIIISFLAFWMIGIKDNHLSGD